MAFLDDLKRKLQLAQMQQGQQPTAVMNDPGISGRDTTQGDLLPGGPVTSAPAPPLTRPRSVMANVRQAVTPIAQPATLDQALMGGGPTQVEQPQQQVQQQPQQQSQFNIPENPYRQRLQTDEERLSQLESQPVGFWKRFGTGLLQRAITRRGEAPIPITKRQRDIADTQARLGREMKIGQDVGQMDAREAAIYARQQQLGMQQDKLNQGQSQFEQKQRNVRRQELIREHSAQTDFDPADPKNAGFVDSWTQEFGRSPLPNVRGSQYGYRQGLDDNGNVVPEVYNKGTGKTTGITGSSITTTEAGANRAAANTRSANTIAAANQRAAGRQGQGRGPTLDKTATRRAAKLTGDIEATRKELEAYDARTPANERDEANRTRIANKAAAAITELNNLGAGYEAGMGTGGYPYSKQTGAGEAAAPQAQGPYVGKKFSRAKVAERAKSLGMTPAQAEKQITDGGGTIY